MCHHLVLGLADGLDMYYGTRSAWWDERLAAMPQGFCRVAATAVTRIWDEANRYKGDVEALRLRVRREANERAAVVVEGAWIISELDRIVATGPGVRV